MEIIKRIQKILNESLLSPDIDDAREFIYREYQKAKSKYADRGDYATKVPLLPIIKKVINKFNSFGSNLSIDNLIKYYIKSQLSLDSGNRARIESEMSYYGIDTLPKEYLINIDEKFIGYVEDSSMGTKELTPINLNPSKDELHKLIKEYGFIY